MTVAYRVLPFIGKIKGNQSAVDVSSQLESAINQNAASGWEFVESTNVNIEVQPGCLAGLFGASTAYIRFDMLIFRQTGFLGTPLVSSDAATNIVPPASSHMASDAPSSENARKIAKRLAALGFSVTEIVSQLQDRGVPEADAQAAARGSKGG